MDQIITKMSVRGNVLTIDTSHFKANSNSETNNEINGLGAFVPKGGFLFDVRSSRNLKLIDYVHSNDLNHLHKHISDGGISYFLLF